MLNNFTTFFKKQENKIYNYTNNEQLQEINRHANGFIEMFSLYDGESFGDGLYRLHKISDFNYWNSMITRAFPEYENKFIALGTIG